MISLGLQAQNLGIKLADGTSPNTTLDINGAVSFREGTALTLVNGVNSNITLSEYSFLRVTGPTAAFSITGFTGGNDGRVLTIMNNTSQVMTLVHQSTSTAANQINTGGTNTTIAASGLATFYYNTNLSKWIVTAVTGATPTFTTINTGNYSDSMIVINNGVPGRVPPREYIETYAWGLDGNAGTVDGTHFLGTMDNIPLSIRVNNQKAGRIDHLQSNAFWGYQAGNAITTGSYNTALGQSALAALTQGTANLGVGTSALAALTTGSDNTAVGSSTLATMTTGNSNVAIGNQSGLSNTTGVRNVSIGYQSARNGTHSNSIMIGYQAGLQNAASNNVFIGSLSGPLTSTGSDNIGMGYYTLFNNQTGKNNIGIGSFALSTTTAAWGNTSIGHMSSASIQTGQANTALGDSSLMNNVLGNNNTHIGYRAGLWTTGSNNIAIGYNATLPVITADNQLALGTWLYGTNNNLGINTITPQYKLDIDANTSGMGNPLRLQGLQAGATSDSIITSSSGLLRRMAMNNLAWTLTGNSGTNPSSNFVGTTDAQDLVIKTNNAEAVRVTTAGNLLVGALTPGEPTGIALVSQSASDQEDDITSTTYNSTTTPSFVVFKARGTAAAPTSLTNSEILGGYNANGYKSGGFTPLTAILTVTSSDYTTAFGGELSFRTARSNTITERMRITSTGNVGIGVAAPSHILQINGQGRATSTTWTTTSDIRLKNIDGTFEYGLKELLKINTYRFHYKKDNPLNLPTDNAFQGVVAQDLQKVIPEAVTKQADGYLTVNSDPVFWTMLNSIKELNSENEKVKAENNALKSELNALKMSLNKQGIMTENLISRLEKLEAALNTKSPSDNPDKTDKK